MPLTTNLTRFTLGNEEFLEGLILQHFRIHSIAYSSRVIVKGASNINQQNMTALLNHDIRAQVEIRFSNCPIGRDLIEPNRVGKS